MNYNFILDIHNQITKKVLYEHENEEVRKNYKNYLKLLELFTKNIKIKPKSIVENPINSSSFLYDFTVNTETGKISISAIVSDEMYVKVADEERSIGYSIRNGYLNNMSGSYKCDVGTYLIQGENQITTRVEPEEMSTLQALSTKHSAVYNTVYKFKIDFYDNESMSYLEGYQTNSTVQMTKYYLENLGICPTEEIEITASTQEELITLANEFYLDPINFINKYRQTNTITNTEERGR